MKCPNCYNEIPADSKFCPDCGRKVEKTQTNDNQVFNIKGVSFKMIRVEHGRFKMGELVYGSPIHTVILTNDYYIGETLVTQALWEVVMGSNPSHFRGDDLPVESVSWNDCQEFIQKLNAKTGKKFRLPTEAEWEFAARGGNKSKGYEYSGSENIDEVAWYGENSENKTHPVKTKNPNELGIYDMCGNVHEWCQDVYGKYSSREQTNPTGSNREDCPYRVSRGGCWSTHSWGYRIANHAPNLVGNRSPRQGFRLALSE